MKLWHTQNQGFSLLEVLAAVAILGLITVPLFSAFSSSSVISTQGYEVRGSTAIAENIAEEFEVMNFDHWFGHDTIYPPTITNGDGSTVQGVFLTQTDTGEYVEATTPPTDGAALYEIAFSAVSFDHTVLDAVVTLNAAGNFYEVNSAEVVQHTPYEYSFVQSRSPASQDPDQVSWNEFLLAAATHGYDTTRFTKDKIQSERVVELILTVDDTDRIHANLKFQYQYTFPLAEGVVEEGVPIGIQNTVFQWENAGKDAEITPTEGVAMPDVSAGETFPNFYLKLYPWYYNTVQGEQITLRNEENLPLTVAIVKQRDPLLSDAAWVDYEDDYHGQVRLYERTEGAATVLSNLNLHGNTGAVLPRWFFLPYVGIVQQPAKPFDGEASLVSVAQENRLYEMTVDLYPRRSNGTTDWSAGPIHTLQVSNLQ